MKIANNETLVMAFSEINLDSCFGSLSNLISSDGFTMLRLRVSFPIQGIKTMMKSALTTDSLWMLKTVLLNLNWLNNCS